MSNNTMQQAAVIIQKYFRAYEVRKKYTVRDLEKNEKTSYNATIIGNDPYISNALDSYKTEQKIAFISVSSMRIVDIACQITSDTKHTPKIIVIDNSSKVSNLWRNIRAFSEKNNTSAENFLKVLPALLNDNREFFLEKSFNYIASQRTDYIPIVKRGEILRFNANAITFFKYLFEKYSFEKVMKIILGATVICQSWTDTNTLVSVKNVLNSIGIEKIYMYPSNLVACFGDDKEIQMEILENIKKNRPFYYSAY
ncbi:MAG: IQ calmodulin-binding motif-containing protein [Pseudomonadota bacterium]